ncbi:protein elf4-like 4, partial [Phtheirospermum japonicum]
EDDIFPAIANGSQIETKLRQTFQKNFVQVQNILDQNRLLINEINQNNESKIPDNLTRNVGLIRELNNNIRSVVIFILISLIHLLNRWMHLRKANRPGRLNVMGEVGKRELGPVVIKYLFLSGSFKSIVKGIFMSKYTHDNG